MTLESLAYRNAQEHVRAFATESEELLNRHDEAMECRDCEALLQMGIDAFQWLVRADIALRLESAPVEFDETVEQVLQSLAKVWLGPCQQVKQLIKTQLERGFELDNLAAFRECCDEMRAIVAFNELPSKESLPDGMAALRDQALTEFRSGETSEFFSE